MNPSAAGPSTRSPSVACLQGVSEALLLSRGMNGTNLYSCPLRLTGARLETPLSRRKPRVGYTRIGLMAGSSLLVALGAVSAQADTAQETARKRLIEAVTVPGIQEHLRVFARIARKYDDNRAAGTAGYGASANYVAAKLRK